MSWFLKNWASLYSGMTDAEKAMEPAIAALGRPYRCQHPFWDLSCFADFILLEDKVIIEVDGKSHNSPGQKIKDLTRTLALLRRGWRTVRIRNEDAMTDPAGALSRALRGNEDKVPDLERRLAELQRQNPVLVSNPPSTRPPPRKKPRVPPKP